MKQMRVIFIIFLLFLCMVSPSIAYTYTYDGDTTDVVVAVDEDFNVAWGVVVNINGAFDTMQSVSDESSASVEQGATGSTTGLGSSLFMASGAHNCDGNTAKTELMASGNTQVGTQQAAESDESGSSAGQSTSLKFNNGMGEMATSVRNQDGWMNTGLEFKGNGEISTEQFGIANGSFGYSTLGVYQASDLSLDKCGAVETYTTAPYSKISIWMENGFYNDLEGNNTQSIVRTVNGNDYQEDAGNYNLIDLYDGIFSQDIGVRTTIGNIHIHSYVQGVGVVDSSAEIHWPPPTP